MSNMGSRETFAKNLRRYMVMNSATQKDVAKVVGVSTSTFNDWMKARKYPRIDKIEKLARYFGIMKSDLIEDAPEEQMEFEHNIYLNADELDIIGKYKGLSPGQKRVIRQTMEAFLWE